MLFILANDIVASRPPKRRPTGTPTAHANDRHLGNPVTKHS